MNFKLPKGEDWVFPFLTNSTFQPSLGLMYWPIDGVLESHLEKFTRSNWILIFKETNPRFDSPKYLVSASERPDPITREPSL